MNTLAGITLLKNPFPMACLLLGVALLPGCQKEATEETPSQKTAVSKSTPDITPEKTEPAKKTEEPVPQKKTSAKGQQELPPAPPSSEDLAVKELEKFGGKWKFNKNDNVDEVALTGPEITDGHLIILQAFPYLSRLDLTGTSITDEGLKHLESLDWLRYLFLLGTGITDEGVARLKDHSRLEQLCLDGTKVSDAGVKHLEGLNRMVMLHLATEGEITDACIDSLLKMPDLREIKVEGTKVTEDGKARLQKAFPEIKFIGETEEGIPVDQGAPGTNN